MSGRAGLIIIGDELLSGKRKDRHFEYALDTLTPLGWQLAWVQILGDDQTQLAKTLRHSMAESIPVFSFGGIGATPDDVTRQAAAQAAGVELIRHPGAVAEIEAQFGEAAYPNRIRMAELPEGCELIPNPVNRIPGFSIKQHYFLPGFPEMAWPMMQWVLQQYYPSKLPPMQERVVWLFDTPESQLIDLMEQLGKQFPKLKFYSLPHLQPHRYIELGLRGREGVDEGFVALQQALAEAGEEYEVRM